MGLLALCNPLVNSVRRPHPRIGAQQNSRWKLVIFDPPAKSHPVTDDPGGLQILKAEILAHCRHPFLLWMTANMRNCVGRVAGS